MFSVAVQRYRIFSKKQNKQACLYKMAMSDAFRIFVLGNWYEIELKIINKVDTTFSENPFLILR